MTTYKSRWSVVALVVLAVVGFAGGEAAAQCCGQSAATYAPVAYQSAYAPAAYQTYQPVVYQSAYSGWYPGQMIDRMRMNFWGTPTTYTTAYAPSYTAAYAPTYTASYPMSYSVGYAPSYSVARPVVTTSYMPAASACCGATQAVVMRPAASCCDPCGGGVASAVYQSSPSDCPGCTASYDAPATPTGTYTGEPKPELAPQENPAEQRTYERPTTPPETSPEATPETKQDSGESSVLESEPDEGSSTYLQPPQLFQPEDRTTQLKSKTPVWTAVYHRPAAGGVTVGEEASDSRAELHAVGWTSVAE